MRVSQSISLLAAVLLTSSANAFTTFSNPGPSTTTTLGAMNSDRRSFFRNAAGVAFGAAAVVANGQEANASYSAYANREKDWQERKESGGKFILSQKVTHNGMQSLLPMLICYP
jgi:hypothetical protein